MSCVKHSILCSFGYFGKDFYGSPGIKIIIRDLQNIIQLLHPLNYIQIYLPPKVRVKKQHKEWKRSLDIGRFSE